MPWYPAPVVATALLGSQLFATAAAQEFTEEIEPPPAISDEEVLEPEVTIRRRGEDTVEEYRINGRLYMIKITPSAGPSYYLVDNDGDGSFTKHMGQIYEDFEVPKWVIFSW